MTVPALVIAAPSSGAGKTTLSLGIMAALRARGLAVRAAKSGPDFIDPAFHEAATGAASVNLDAWSMSRDGLRTRALAQGGDILIIEAAMGILDAGADGRGSAADLAISLGAPVVLVIDVAKTGQSAALAAAGLTALRPDINLAGVIFNRVGSERHLEIASGALPDGVRVLGAVFRDQKLVLPERHLGLVQAAETTGLQAFLDHAAQTAQTGINLDLLVASARPVQGPDRSVPKLPPLGQRIAVARDVAFAFCYSHLLSDWRAQGAEILPFSPLADDAPDGSADAVFLPGGYPELHAGTLANAANFKAGMQTASARDAVIYGECGGYMVLGTALIDGAGHAHAMLDLLPQTTDFSNRKMTLGYRRLTPLSGPFSGNLFGHEFHYSTVANEGSADRLFAASDASGTALGDMGLVRGNVSGSYAHIIAPAFDQDGDA